MPGQYLTEEEMYQICRRAAEAAATQYGVKDVEAFTQALMVVAFAESGSFADQGLVWDSQSVHDNGQGFGLFALHNQGYAGFLTKDQRLDAQTNANAAAMKLATVWQDGDSFDANVKRMTGNAMAAFRQVEQRLQPGMPTGIAEGGARPSESRIATIIQELGLTPERAAALGFSSVEDLALSTYFMDMEGWNRFFLQRGEGEGLTPLERRATEADIAYKQALTRDVLAGLDPDEYERTWKEYLQMVAEGQWTAEQGIREFNATEPGGINEQMYKRYGLEYKPSPGIPVEEMPRPEEAYATWHQRMGVPERAPTMQGYTPPTMMGQQGTGFNAAMAFLQRMGLGQRAGGY
ncbi:MAG: hypothetical protein AMJ38_03160 [Dehalococcoidia bacterium DG_22]|nr:MAG: hypothetical protein AMJ38_03160 [Dehalococcoidia bacterium DG_22]